MLPTYRHPRRLLAAGAVAGILARAWFVDAPLGVGFFVFTLLWVIALRALGGRESWQRAGAVKWLLVPMLLGAGFVAVRAAETLTMLNVAMTACLGCLCVHAFAGDRVLSALGLRGYVAAGFSGLGRALFAGPVLVTESVDGEAVGGAFRQYFKPVLRATVLATPILAIFAALLASADEVFSMTLETELKDLANGSLTSMLSTCCVVIGVGLVTAGGWAVALRRREAGGAVLSEAKESSEASRTHPEKQHRGAFEAFAIAGSLTVLFAVFGAIQARCLFGKAMLPYDLSWSAYARQGFFQLLVVAGLTVALITTISRVAILPDPLTKPFAALCAVLVGFTVLILASAVKRLTLYEEMYGFTELRVYSHVFAYALGAMLLWRAATLWKWTQAFASGALVAMIGFVLALDVMNPDAFIAEKNLARHSDVVGVDRSYLSRLSVDAYPVLREDQTLAFVPHAEGWASWNLARWSATLRE